MKKSLSNILFVVIFLMGIIFIANGCSLNSDKSTSTEKVTDNSSSTETIATNEGSEDDDCEIYEEDVFGEDLANIPRYPGSIRSYYAEDEYEIDVTYQTKDTEEKVREYYTNLLTDAGWKQTGKATDYIDFEKGDEDNPEMITVYFTPDKDCGILEYELVYSPPLTDEELAELEEEEE